MDAESKVVLAADITLEELTTAVYQLCSGQFLGQ